MKKKKSNLPFAKGQIVVSGVTADGQHYHIGLNYTASQWEKLSKEERQQEIIAAVNAMQTELIIKRFVDFVTAANMLRNDVNLDKAKNVPVHIRQIYDLARSVAEIDKAARVNHKCDNLECHGCYGLN